MRAIAQRDDIRDLILDAADQLLARYGYAKMTIDDLAREVGIGKGTVYLHFTSKEEIALAHIDRLVGRVISHLREIAHSQAPAAERLERMLCARVLDRFDAVKHYKESLAEKLAAIRPALDELRSHHFETEAGLLAEVIRQGQSSGELSRKTDPERAAASMIAATNAFLPYSLSRRQLGRRSEVAETVAGVAELLLHGLV